MGQSRDCEQAVGREHRRCEVGPKGQRAVGETVRNKDRRGVRTATLRREAVRPRAERSKSDAMLARRADEPSACAS